MRTGIIHLTGFAATLVVVSTALLWVDYGTHVIAVRLGVPPYEARAWSYRGQLRFHLSINDQLPSSMKLAQYIRKDIGNPWLEMESGVIHQAGSFGVTWNRAYLGDPDGQTVYRRDWILLLPHWCVIAVAAVPMVLYLRFLRNRKRNVSVDDTAGQARPLNGV